MIWWKKNTSNIFWTQDHQWGTFVEKSDFSPLKVENTENIFQKSEKSSLTGPGPLGREGQQYEKNFFAFLDELNHLEAIKKY